MAYQTLDRKGCGTTLAINTTVSGTLTISRCPTNAPAGSTVVVGATARNTGVANNNSFVILITVADGSGQIVASGNSGNMTVTTGATSPEATLSFTMPASGVSVAFELQADPVFNY